MQPIHTIIKVETVTKQCLIRVQLLLLLLCHSFLVLSFCAISQEEFSLVHFCQYCNHCTTATMYALLMQGPPLTLCHAVCKAQSLLEKKQFLPFERLEWAD